MNDLVVRPLRADEASTFDSVADPGIVGLAAIGRTFGFESDGGEYRPQWTWIAARDDETVARAAWWGAPTDAQPKTLDWLDFSDADAAVALLAEAPYRTDYHLMVPVDWASDEGARAEVDRRSAVVEQVGMQCRVERIQYRWTTNDKSLLQTRRLHFRPESADARFTDIVARISVGSLDDGTRADVAEFGTDEAAGQEVDFWNWLPGRRAWWRLAFNEADELVGIMVPSKTHAGPSIAFVGVLPEKRGHGYGADLLAGCAQFLAEDGAQAITATTDSTNTPMVAAFAKVGFPVAHHRLIYSHTTTT